VEQIKRPGGRSDLEGRVIVITGAGRGIGAGCAVLCARRGARVVLAARSQPELSRVCRAIAEDGGHAMPVVCDVSDPEQVLRLFAEARERYGPVDALVNNAGVLTPAPLHEQRLEDFEQMLKVNVTGTFLCCQQALADMLPRGNGVIVNIASVSGLPNVERLPGISGYAASKGAVVALSEALAAEVVDAGVRVVALSPGSVATPMLAGVAPDAMTGAMRPGAVAEVVAFLASDAAMGVTRTNWTVWGGPQAIKPPR
jgi:NAD(P)-dependent dehydrogenase (short-subunit alcohol dehydrogenase family)